MNDIKDLLDNRPGLVLLSVMLCLLVSLTNGCSRGSGIPHASAQGRTVVQNIGSDTMVNLAQAWAEEYAMVDPAVSVEVSGGGSGTGIAALINGTADIANSSRRIDAGEVAKVKAANGQDPKMHIVGYDALAIFVHRASPLNEITIGQLAAIYSEKGAVRSWSDLEVQVPGCRDNQMILVSRQSNSGTYHYFREAILGKGADFKLGTLDLHGSKDVVELVSRTPCAIGYSGMGYATPHIKMLRVARKPGEPAFMPSVETTQLGKYPISRPLYMYTRGEPSAAVKKYLDWINTADGQQIILDSGYVPLAKGAMLRVSSE